MIHANLYREEGKSFRGKELRFLNEKDWEFDEEGIVLKKTAKWITIFAILLASFFILNTNTEKLKNTLEYKNGKEYRLLFTDIELLTLFHGRRSGTEDEAKVVNYLTARFQDIGLKPFSNGYVQTFELPGVQLATNLPRPCFRHINNHRFKGLNVIGFIRGTDSNLTKEYILVTAHHDHLGVHQKTVYEGANDNASGVGVLLNTAEHLARQTTKRSVVFVAFGGEEMGCIGSQKFVDDPPVPLEKIAAVVNLDTLGGNSNAFSVWSKNKMLQEYISKFAIQNGFQVVNKNYPDHMSDHFPFEAAGIPAVTLTSPDWIELSHTTTDTFQNLNKDKIIRACELNNKLISQLANSDIAF